MPSNIFISSSSVYLEIVIKSDPPVGGCSRFYGFRPESQSPGAVWPPETPSERKSPQPLHTGTGESISSMHVKSAALALFALEHFRCSLPTNKTNYKHFH